LKSYCGSGVVFWLQCIAFAFGDGDPAIHHVTCYSECCSLFEPIPDVIDMFEAISAILEGGNFRVVDRVEIGTLRLDDIIESPLIDCAELNIKGAELRVLENGMERLSQAVLIKTEVEFVKVYRGQPLFSDIQTFRRSQGFAPHKLNGIFGRNFNPLSSGDPTDAMSQFL
jgi:hypothetical protein